MLYCKSSFWSMSQGDSWPFAGPGSQCRDEQWRGAGHADYLQHPEARVWITTGFSLHSRNFSIFKCDYTSASLLLFFFIRTNESDVVIKHKVKVICQRIQNLKVCYFLFQNVNMWGLFTDFYVSWNDALFYLSPYTFCSNSPKTDPRKSG